MGLGSSYPISFVLRAIDKTGRGISSANSKVGKLTKGAAKAGRAMTMGLTAPIAAAGVAVFRTAARFEKGMNRVTALSSTSAKSVEQLARDMAGLEEVALELGKTSVFTASEVTDAMGFYAQAGFDAKQITEATLPTLNLAAAAQIELGESADITAGILAGYSWEASRAGEVSDVLTNAFTKAKTDLPALGEAMKVVGPLAAGMGISLSKTVSAIQVLSEKSIGGAEAGTKLRNMLLSIQKPTASAKRALNALKIEARSLVDETGRVADFATIIEALTKAGAEPKHLSSIFKVRDITAMMALVAPGPEGEVAFERMRNFESGLDRLGSSAAIAKIQMRGAAGSTARFTASMERLSISIGKSGFLEWATNSIDALTGFASSASDVDAGMKKIGLVALGVVAVAGPVIWAASAMSAAIAGIGIAASASIALVAGIVGMGALIVTEAAYAKKATGYGDKSWSEFIRDAWGANMAKLPWNQPFAHVRKTDRQKSEAEREQRAADWRFGYGERTRGMSPVWLRAMQMNSAPVKVKFEGVPNGVSIHVPSGVPGVEIGYRLGEDL